MKRVIPLTLPFALAGCLAGGDFASRNTNVDYGPAVSQQTCQQIAKRHVGPTLLKPDTAQYKFGRCMADTLSPKPLIGLPKQSGYAMSFAVNGQNAFGTYTGFKNYEVLIYNGAVVRRIRQNQMGQWETF